MVASRVPPGAASAFLGREAELDRLQQRLQTAAGGRGSLVQLRGPAGCGGTRTAHELAARADRLGMLVLWGRAREGIRGRPYAAIASALDDYATGLPAETLAAQLGPGAAALVRLAPRLGLALTELMPPAPLEARDERLRLYAATLSWLAAAGASQPLLLVLDDMQWADEDTLALLAYLAARVERLPLLVLLVSAVAQTEPVAAQPAAAEPVAVEPAAAQPAATELASHDRLEPLAAETVVLGGLDQGATAALLTGLADQPLSDEAIELIQQVTGGEPLWARELYLFLRQENRLDAIHGRGLPEPAELPETLEQLVAWRTSRFSPEVRSALAALAAFDEGAEPAVLAQVSGLSRSRSIEFLEIAAAAGLCRSTAGGQRYAISHDRLRLAMLAGLTAVQRSQLERHVAESLEAELAENVREQASELLHHYRHSAALDGAERGVRHGLLAAEQARAAYAHRRAAQCLSLSRQLVPPEDRRLAAELSARLAVAQAEAGLGQAAVETAAEALRRQRQLGARAGELLQPLVEVMRALRGDGARGAEHDALEELRRLGLEYAAGADQLERARLDLLAEHWQEPELGSVPALIWSQSSPVTGRILAEASLEEDRAELLLPQRLRTRDESSRAASWGRGWRRPASVLRALAAVSLDLLSRHGLYREGAAWAGLYRTTAERYGSLRDLLAAKALLARGQAVLGHLDEAQQTLQEGRQLLGEIEPLGQLPLELLIGELLLDRYRDTDRAGLLERTAGLAAEPLPSGLLLAAELCLLRALTGDEAGARELLPDVLLACARLPPLTFQRDAALLCVLDAAWELGAAEHSTEGRRLLDLAISAGVGSQPHGSLRLAKARMLGLAGDVDEARSYFAEDREMLDELGLRPLRAILDHDEGLAIAAAGAGNDGPAVELLQRAAAQFSELGMEGWARRTGDLLEMGLDRARLPGGRLHFTYPRGLARREADVVRLIAAGLPLSEVAGALELDEEAASRYLDTAMEKLEVSTPEELPQAARRYGLGGGA